MPILKLISYRNKSDFRPSVMGKVMAYCLQPTKTKLREEVFATSGQNCVPWFAYEQFMTTKEFWHKTDGLCFRHYVQSFDPNEKITPLLANEIARKFAARAWEGYEVLIATHVDRAHIHTHLIVNTVHPETGKKLHETPTNLGRLRAISDEICAAHGLSVLPGYDGKRKTMTMGSGEYRSARRGQSWKIRLRKAIGAAMEWSYTREEFIANMSELGYDVRWESGRKNITYTCRCEKPYRDGKFPKCNDDKLSDKKYLKGNMEYEFTLRKAIFLGGTDEHKRSATADGADQRGGMEPSRSDAETHGSVDRERNGREDSPDYGGRGVPRGNETGGDRTDQSGERSDPDGRGASRTTGWEREQKSLPRHRTPNDPRRIPLVVSSALHGFAHHPRPLIGGLYGLASAISVSDPTDESEEMKKEREARERGSMLGAALGTVIGILAAENAPQTPETDSEGQVPTEEQPPATGENDGGFPFDMTM